MKLYEQTVNPDGDGLVRSDTGRGAVRDPAFADR